MTANILMAEDDETPKLTLSNPYLSVTAATVTITMIPLQYLPRCPIAISNYRSNSKALKTPKV